MTIDWPSFTLGVVALFALSTVTVACISAMMGVD